jgi:D-alanyl-lipoteichoic acid acyltransferase DltB (MBOAT superfamily)
MDEPELRDAGRDDAAMIAAWLNRPEINRYLSQNLRHGGMTALLVGVGLGRPDQHWMLFGPPSGPPCGLIALDSIEREDGHANVWFVLGDPGLAGRGLTSRALLPRKSGRPARAHGLGGRRQSRLAPLHGQGRLRDRRPRAGGGIDRRRPPRPGDPGTDAGDGVPSLIAYVFGLAGLALVAAFVGGRARAALLVAASIVFYAGFDWRFPLILSGVAAATFLGGLHLDGGRRGRAAVVLWSMTILGPLLVYKYLFVWLDGLAGILPVSGLDFGDYGSVLIPVGLSFYSFQCLGYLVDVHRAAYPADRDPLRLALFICFFPQLLAGPIERYPALAPQLWSAARPTPDMVLNGLVLIAYGTFLKLAVADRLAASVDLAFERATVTGGGANALIGFAGFAFQLLADFGGYSLIAVGAGLLFGVTLTMNFRQPFFSADIVEFWQRWHVSLTRWVGDYVYRPVGRAFLRHTSWPSRLQEAATAVIVWTTLGMWHGAHATFAVFGLVQAGAIIGYKVVARRRGPVAVWRLAAGMVLTFAFVVVTFGLIRVPDLGTFAVMVGDMATLAPGPAGLQQTVLTCFCVAAMLSVEALNRLSGGHRTLSVTVRAALLAVLMIGIALLGNEDGRSFIYFRF